MNTTETQSRHSVQRQVRRCHCEYQKQKAWGYNLQKWVGGRKSWKEIGNATHPEDVEKYAQRFDTVLIRCNGCGADIVREYPPNA
jgi:hypothetical protein